MAREQVTTVPRQAGGAHVACAPAAGRVSDPSALSTIPAHQHGSDGGLANASQAWRARARTTRHARTCPPCPCAHNAARPHLQRGVDGREQVTTVPRRQARGGHVACAPAGGRVSDPSTEVKTPARDKQRRVQPRCPRPDQLSPASSARRGGRAAPSPLLWASARFRRRARKRVTGMVLPCAHNAARPHLPPVPVLARRGTPAPATVRPWSRWPGSR